MKKSSKTSSEPVTAIFSWTVKPGKDELFEDLLHDIHKVARTFPGHMGVTTLKSPDQTGKYQTILRFDNAKHLENWLHSDIRKQMVALVAEIAKIETTSKATGLETWFELPGQHTNPPPRWKMVIVTFVAIYPLSLAYGLWVTPRTAGWPASARALILPIFAPIILTYLFMPFLTRRVFNKWLYNDAGKNRP